MYSIPFIRSHDKRILISLDRINANECGGGMEMQTDLLIALQNEFLFEILKQRTYLTNDKPQKKRKENRTESYL